MKKLSISILIVACSFFVGCYYDDDGGYISLEIQDAITFENNLNYVVGDTLFFELNFSRYLDEAGFTNKLDVFESSGVDSFYYYYSLNKFSEQAGGFREIAVADEFVYAEKGTIRNGGADAKLNPDMTVYESRVGIILVETGSFQLDFDFFRLNSFGYSQDKVRIDIEHTFSSGINKFEFEVTE